MTTQLDPLVSVRNLRVSFRLDGATTFEAVRGHLVRHPAQYDGRAGRRIGLGQVA